MADSGGSALDAFRAEAREWLEANYPKSLRDDPRAGERAMVGGFKPEGDQTSATWSVAAHHNFMEKALCLIFGGQRMMAGFMEKGLAQLKSVAESKPSASVN